MHQSIATIDAPEFINLQPLDINPLMSSCEIKVLYVGENRNRSFISKDVANEMAKTLRGAPIVGYYREEKEDFADHGEKVVIDDQGVHFECMTKPYGFVAPDAKVWWQKFSETDQYGQEIVREYLMTTGYLWTGQFEECAAAAQDDGRPHSMELDKKTLQGNWSQDFNSGMEFFIINDAIFSKLCILGEDVEPCFEGSSVTPPKVSASFTKMEDFQKTLFTMMQDLKFALEGGQQKMNDEKILDNSEQLEASEIQNDTESSETSFVAKEKEEEEKETSTSEESKDKEEDEEEKKDKYAKEDEEKEEKSEEKSEEESSDKEDEKEDEKKKDYSLLESELAELSKKYEELESRYQAKEAECNELFAFKKEIEDKEKDALIQQFCMIDDEDADKKAIIEKKSEYSLSEIEEKLAVICFRKGINFNLDDTVEDTEAKEAPITYNLEGDFSSSVPAWVKAVMDTQNTNI